MERTLWCAKSWVIVRRAFAWGSRANAPAQKAKLGLGPWLYALFYQMMGLNNWSFLALNDPENGTADKCTDAMSLCSSLLNFLGIICTCRCIVVRRKSSYLTVFLCTTRPSAQSALCASGPTDHFRFRAGFELWTVTFCNFFSVQKLFKFHLILWLNLNQRDNLIRELIL
jgi:hypothetical protein